MALSLYAEELADSCFIQVCADHAKLADDCRTAHPNVCFLRNIVEVNPRTSVGAGDDTLSTEDHAVDGLVLQSL